MNIWILRTKWMTIFFVVIVVSLYSKSFQILFVLCLAQIYGSSVYQCNMAKPPWTSSLQSSQDSLSTQPACLLHSLTYFLHGATSFLFRDILAKATSEIQRWTPKKIGEKSKKSSKKLLLTDRIASPPVHNEWNRNCCHL